MTAGPLIAAIDLGGTTAKVAVADGTGRLLGEDRVATRAPDATLAAAAAALRRLEGAAGGRIDRLGVACFGPVDVDPASGGYGTILRTPKPGWTGAPVLRVLSDALGVPARLDTDVNAALAGELIWGRAKGADRAAYVTVGTGIGVGVKAGGAFAGRPFHPELGHIRVSRRTGDEGFAGVCAFHGGCLEGLAAAPALAARFGDLEQAGPASEAWAVAAHYLAQLTVTLVLGFRVERILFGGGVSNAAPLIGLIRARHDELMAGYVADAPTEELIATARHGDKAGLYGACAIAL